MPSLLFRCFSLFLPHLRTLAQGKRSENCLRFGTGGPSLCLYPLLSRNILFFPALTMAARAKKKISGEAICSRYQRALSGFWARFRILNLIARLCWLCYNYILFRHMIIIDCHSLWLAETKYFVRVYMHERCHTISRTSLSFLFPSFSPTSVHDF